MCHSHRRGLAQSKALWGLIGNSVSADSVGDGEEMEKLSTGFRLLDCRTFAQSVKSLLWAEPAVVPLIRRNKMGNNDVSLFSTRSASC